MQRPIPVGIVGPSSKTYTEHQTARLVNGYLEAGDGDAKSPVAIIGTPGIASFYSGLEAPIRALYVMDGRLFIVGGSKIYEGYADGTKTEWASLPSDEGPVGLSSNNGKLVIGDGYFRILDLETGDLDLLLVEDTDPLEGFWSDYIDGTTLFLERNTGQVWYSEINDPGTVTGLSFGAAEGSPDKNVHLRVVNREIIISQTNSIEYWASTGDTDDPFARVEGGFVEGGAVTPFVEADNSLFWIGRDDGGQGIVRRLQGYQGQRVSTHAVEKAIREYSGDLTAVVPRSYQEEGHWFVLFDLDTTWVYDAATGFWHERAWTNPATGEFEPQRQANNAFAFNRQFCGDRELGKVYAQSLETYSDAGDPLVLERITPHNFGQGRAFICDEFEVFMETGVGLDGTGQGTDPVAMLRYSTDGGRNWSNELSRSIGRIGETRTRVRWNRLGMGRDWVFRLSISDPVRRVITGAQALARVGR